MSSHGPRTGSPSGLERIRGLLEAWKPRLIKGLLALVALLYFAAEFIEPLGEVLRGDGFLDGSFAALIALVLFDAIGNPETREAPGVYALDSWEDLDGPVREAFTARNIRVDFSGFTMETLFRLLHQPLTRMGDEEVKTRELTLHIIVAHLNLPMSLPAGLDPAPEDAGLPDGTVYFGDSEDNRRRMRDDYTRRYWNDLKTLLADVHTKNPHINITCEVRESPQIPERKFYVLNQEKVFHQPYGIVDRTLEWDNSELRILDTAGFGRRYAKARVLGWDIRSTSPMTQTVAEHHMEWQRSLWDMLRYIKPRDPIITDPTWVRVGRRAS